MLGFYTSQEAPRFDVNVEELAQELEEVSFGDTDYHFQVYAEAETAEEFVEQLENQPALGTTGDIVEQYNFNLEDSSSQAEKLRGLKTIVNALEEEPENTGFFCHTRPRRFQDPRYAALESSSPLPVKLVFDYRGEERSVGFHSRANPQDGVFFGQIDGKKPPYKGKLIEVSDYSRIEEKRRNIEERELDYLREVDVVEGLRGYFDEIKNS